VQAGVLPAQDGQLMPQGDEFELQCEATTNPEREQGTEGGQKREHAGDGMTVAQEVLHFLCIFDFSASTELTSVLTSAKCFRCSGSFCPRLGFMPNQHVFCCHRRSKARQFTLEAEVFIR